MKNRGFTLIETFVAIVILMLAVATQIVIAQRGINAATNARENLVAQYLAQDAIEQVRMMRDQNVMRISGGDTSVYWLDNMWDECQRLTAESCRIERNVTTGGNLTSVNDITFRPCSSGVCPTMTYNSISGIYDYETGTNWVPTTFNRSIWIEQLSPVDDSGLPTQHVKVVVKVTWRQGGGSGSAASAKSIELSDIIFNRGI